MDETTPVKYEIKTNEQRITTQTADESMWEQLLWKNIYFFIISRHTLE